MRTTYLTLTVLALASLAACGGDDVKDTLRVKSAATLHVRAAGMVKSLGIT